MKLDEMSWELSVQFAETKSLSRDKQLFCYFLNENKDKEKRVNAPKDTYSCLLQQGAIFQVEWSFCFVTATMAKSARKGRWLQLEFD